MALICNSLFAGNFLNTICMKISHKLILGFWLLTTCVWLVGYLSMMTSRNELEKTIVDHDVFLATRLLEEVNQRIYSRIEIFQEYTRDVLLQNGISRSNASFAGLADIQEYVDTIDHQWRSQDGVAECPVFHDLFNNEVSEELREKIEYYNEKYGYPVFLEVFVTNKYGAIVGLTNKTTDFRQDDEEWWQETIEKGLSLRDFQFDLLSDSFTIEICVRIEDDYGDLLGVLKASLNTAEISHLLKNAEKNGSNSVLGYYLFTREGQAIYPSDLEVEFSQDFFQQEFFDKISGTDGKFFSTMYAHHSDAEQLYVYVRSQGVREFPGFGWILMIGHDPAEVFASVDHLKRNLIWVCIFVSIFAVFVSFLIFRIISHPLTGLKSAVEKLSKGEMGGQVSIHSKDEIGAVAAAFNTLSSELKNTTVSRDRLMREVEERKRSEKALKDSEKQLSIVMNTVLTGIIIIDADSKEVVYANPAALAMIGGSNELIIGKKCYEYICSAER